MEVNKIYCENCLDTMSRMPDNLLDCVITSPPYWQLRDYGYEGQWGLEPTYQEYLEHLWGLMDLIYIKLKPTGTVWINLADVYGSFRGKSGTKPDKFERKQGKTENDKHVTDRPSFMRGLFNKCLLLIPHRFAIGCINRGWILRNDIIWAKRNGMPESITDRFSKKHEYIFFFVKQQKYFFDINAIRDKHAQASIERANRGVAENNKWINGADGQTPHNLSQPRKNIKNITGNMFDGLTRTTVGLSLKTAEEKQHPLGKNPGTVSDFWDIPTKPNHEKHYASYNDCLLVKPVLAGCPEGGIIYDPFMGTGSTAEVSLRSGRKFIGSEMKKEYCEIARKRIDPYLRQLKLFQ